MSDDGFHILAYRSQRPAHIEKLNKLDAAALKKQLLVEGDSGMCVFMMAASRTAPAPVIKALVEAALVAGLDLQAILTRVGSGSKCTVLHWAAHGSDEVTSSCLAYLCLSALDVKDRMNMTPLEYAKAFNRPSSIIAALSQVS